jgi:hypothetical protein
MNDASVTAQVWTSGIVEEVSITVNNKGLSIVKIRVIQDRIPELGDKFSNRHGQKGTIGMLINGCDLPRTASGMVPDMMMNPHAIPSRMTIAQLLESLLGKAALKAGMIGDATAFMNESGIEDSIGDVLQNQFGMQRYGEELFYDGTTGRMIPSTIFVGNVYTMRLKHMVEDKWNARGQGRREQRTHQPTGGRGNQGGLRIGEMERDALIGHGISEFLRESLMKRSDGTIITICNGCGTVPIYNEKDKFTLCSLCDGPVQFAGTSSADFELLPTLKRSTSTVSKVEIPYSLEVLNKELNTYMNMYLRMLTTKEVNQFKRTKAHTLSKEKISELLNKELEPRILPDIYEPKTSEEQPELTVSDKQLEELGATMEVIEKPEEISNAKAEEISKKNIEEIKNNIDSTKGSEQLYEDTDDISVVRSVIPAQTQQVPYVLMPLTAVAQPMSIIQSQIPNAPPTLVVDTSPQAMETEGFLPPSEMKPRSILKNSNSPSRFSRPVQKPNFTISKLDSNNYEGAPATSDRKIIITKEGQ